MIYRYAQVGQTVTLTPPQGIPLEKYYLFWYFGGKELAWRNIFGGAEVNQGEQPI